MRIECPHCSARVRLDEPPDDDTPIRCPECRKKFVPPDDDDDRPARKKKGGRRREDDEEKKGRGVQYAIAGGVVALAAVVGIVVVVMLNKKDDPKPVAANNTNPDPAPVQTPRPTPAPAPPPQQPPQAQPTKKGNAPVVDPDKDPVGKGGTPNTVVQAAQPIPPQYVELFRTAVGAPPPRTVRAADLRPTDADTIPEVPTFHSLMLARKKMADTPGPAPKAAKMTPEEVKKACAYIKVDAGNIGGTGSGFLIGSDAKGALIATNHHVIQAAAKPRYASKPATVTVVFNSGYPDEKSMKADIVAYDPVADLAVLRAEGAGPWPKALSPYNALPKVVEGVDVNIWGFPLGGQLATSSKKNPEISLAKGNVSSLRHSPTGRLDRIQVNGNINPGNSGGPLVDPDGRLVGVAVSTIKGAGIGFAVPNDDLIALLEGRLMNTLFLPTGLDGGKARFLAVVPVMDPMERVDTVYVRRWSGAGALPETVRDPLTGFRALGLEKGGKTNLPGVTEFPLKVFRIDDANASGLGIAIGELDVPEGSPKVLLQVASQTYPNPQTGAKLTAASKPVAYTLSVADHPIGTDAAPFEQLTANPDSLEGRTVVVKGRVAAPPITRDAVQELIIVSSDLKRPNKMRFLVDREAATQFDEVIPEHQPRPVRLVCVVGKRGTDGVLPVRVARLDFLGRGDRVVRTIPAPPAADDKLAELNRDPAKFAGQTLQLKVESVPIMPELLQRGEYAVVFPSQAMPRNLMFRLSPDMLQRMLGDLGSRLPSGAMVHSRVTVDVLRQPVAPGGRAVVAVRKLEVTDAEGSVLATVE